MAEINILIGFSCIYCAKIFCYKKTFAPWMHPEFRACTLTITIINIDWFTSFNVSDQMSCENDQNNIKLQHTCFISIS